MDYRQITSERQFKDATGYSLSDFGRLLNDYQITYISNHGQTYESYIENNVTKTPYLTTLGDSLFFVLFQLKHGLIWGALGAVFGMASSSARDNFVRFSGLLHETLEKKVMPRRSFEDVESFEPCVSGVAELIFDGTETLTVRPANQEGQKEKYSGKKHAHTDIALVLSDKKTRIYYVSRLYDGKNVDMGIFK